MDDAEYEFEEVDHEMPDDSPDPDADATGEDGHAVASADMSQQAQSSEDAAAHEASSPSTAAGGGSSAASSYAVLGIPEPPTSSFLLRQGSYEVTNLHSLSSRMERLMASVVDLLAVSRDDAFFLLMSARWHVETLQDAYFRDVDAYRRKLGLTLGQGAEARPAAPATGGATFYDAVSMDDVDFSKGDALPCGHWFSVDTWREHVTAAAAGKDDDMLSSICPAAPDCSERVRQRMFEAYLPVTLRSRYVLARLRSFAATARGCKHCPGTGCDHVVLYSAGGERDVTCGNGHVFCFKCGAPGHRPASCKQVASWENVMEESGGNTRWLRANTRPCPKCRRPIEKNEGCIHMTCRHTGCGFEFCWLCGEKWTGNYSCKKPPIDGWIDMLACKSAAAELQQLSYFEMRYANHRKGEALAQNLAGSVDLAVEKLKMFMSATEADFLVQARLAVVLGRRVAKWTYPKAYNMRKGGTELSLLEDQQTNLERFLEQLQGAIEGGEIQRVLTELEAGDDFHAAKAKMYEFRLRIVSLTAATVKFANNISEDV